MMKQKAFAILGLSALAFLVTTCNKNPDQIVIYPDGTTKHELAIPEGFPDLFLNAKNPITEEGIALGRKLFYDPILSRNKNISCASCHMQNESFSDNRSKSIGTHGDQTKFHSMPLFNIAWMNEFFWNGRAKSREEQALQPVMNPVEMDLTWAETIERLKDDAEYPFLFQLAFGTSNFDSTHVADALVQFEMTLISGNSKFDRWRRREVELTSQEEFGYYIFATEIGDCFHCHADNGLLTDNSFHNNGLDSEKNLQPGLFDVTGVPDDIGRFKTPTLRNLVFTAPYMHDGRYQTLDQVIDFYSDSVHVNSTVDVLMKKAHQGGVRLVPEQKAALKAFLLTLTDSTILTNPAFQAP